MRIASICEPLAERASFLLRHFALCGVVAALSLSNAYAEGASSTGTPGVETPRCKDAIGRIVRETDATVDHASPSGDNMFLLHPAAKDIVLYCADYAPGLSVSLVWPGAYPPQGFFNLVAVLTGIVTTEKPIVALRAAIRCQTSALKARDEEAEVGTDRMHLDCRAFTRDGGSTLISSGPKPPE